jgi:ABC-type transport system involved in multi-copper enzyme maturation permease subunit
MKPMGYLVAKELKEDLFAGRGTTLLIVAAIVLSSYAVLLVSNKELSLLGNSEAVYQMGSILLALGCLVVVIRASDSFAGERERHTLEALLVAPVSSAATGLAKALGALSSWCLVFIVGAPYIWAVGSTGQNLIPGLAYLFLAGTLAVTAFGGLTMAISARVRNAKAALSIGMAVLLFAAAPLFLGASLRQNAVGRLLDYVNPFANATNTLDSIVIDSQGLADQAIRLIVLLVEAAVAVFAAKLATRKVAL